MKIAKCIIPVALMALLVRPAVGQFLPGQVLTSAELNAAFAATQIVTPTGASVGTSLATRFSWLANAFDFGAKGDGTTDDSTAVNTAAGTGKPLIFSLGSYKLTAASLTNTPSLIMGYGTTLPLNGPSGVTNQAYWNGQSGLLLGKTFTGSTGQATLVVNAVNNQPSGNTGESGAIYASTISNSAYTTGLAGIFQATAGNGNTTASLSSINAYSLWPSGTQGSGSVSEMDVYNSTGTDDAWPINTTTAKTGLFIVSDGTNKPSIGVGIAQSYGGPFRSGLYFFNNSTSNYDAYASNGSGGARWSIDATGNITGQNLYAQTMQLGTFSAAPSLTISTGVGVPSSSANPGSVYINTNQGIPYYPQLYLNTSVGSAGTSWGQICTTNVPCTFSSLKGTVLVGASNTLDDGAGNATINGTLKNGSNAVLNCGAAICGGAVVTPSVSASPYALTASARGTVFISGGTVSSVTLTRGAAVVATGVTAGGIDVVAGDVVTITYTVAPTVKFVPA